MAMLGCIECLIIFKIFTLIMCMCADVSVRYLQKPEDGVGSRELELQVVVN